MPSHPIDPQNVNASPRLPTWRLWLPSRGNVVFVLFVAVALLLYVHTAGAVPGAAPSAASTHVIPYQGRLADSSGNTLSGSYAMTFSLYSTSSGGSSLWTESWSGGNSVVVTNGLFSVMLGSLTPISASLFANNPSLWLGLTVGADNEMAPRSQLGSAPYSMQAQLLPAASITTTMIADGAITAPKLASGLAGAVNFYQATAGSWNIPGTSTWTDVPGAVLTITTTAGVWKADYTGTLTSYGDNGTLLVRFVARPTGGSQLTFGSTTLYRSGWTMGPSANWSQTIALQSTAIFTAGETVVGIQANSNFISPTTTLGDSVLILEH